MFKIFDFYKIVKDLVQKYNTRDPFRIAKEMNAIILKVPLKGINGFYHTYLDQDLIYINDDLTDEEQIIVCAHELGHMVLHHDIDSVFLDSPLVEPGTIELEANAFALQLLQGNLNLSNDIPLIDWNMDNFALKRRVIFELHD